MDKHKKVYEKLQKQAGDAGIDAYLAKLQHEVSDMEKQLVHLTVDSIGRESMSEPSMQ